MESCFDSTISSVHQLATTCIAALASEVSGSGLKVLRLVNRQLCMSMLSEVQAYSLTLSGKADGLLDEMFLLESTSLSRLHVVVTDHWNGVSDANPYHRKPHSLHLRCFIHGLAGAISSVTQLKIDISINPFENSSVEDVGSLLSVLASACPRLLQLELSQDAGQDLLAAFGTSCSGLYSLKVVLGTDSGSLEHLNVTMPHLTHCYVEVPALPYNTRQCVHLGPCCLDILACTRLALLDVGLCKFSQAQWSAIPPCLRELRCSLDEVPPAGLKTLNGLQRLFCYRHDADLDLLQALVAMLRVALGLKIVTLGPQLDNEQEDLLEMAHLQVDCIRSNISNLEYLNSRVSAGLKVLHCNATTEGVHMSFDDSSFQTAVHEHDMWVDPAWDEMHLHYFMHLLPVFHEEFVELDVSMNNSPVCMSHVILNIARSFPRLPSLSFGNCSLNEVERLEACTALQRLSLWNVDEVTALPLATLCSHLEILQELELMNCSGFTQSEAELLRHHLQAQNNRVKLVAGQDSYVDVADDLPMRKLSVFFIL